MAAADDTPIRVPTEFDTHTGAPTRYILLDEWAEAHADDALCADMLADLAGQNAAMTTDIALGVLAWNSLWAKEQADQIAAAAAWLEHHRGN